MLLGAAVDVAGALLISMEEMRWNGMARVGMRCG